jgi:predicted nucleic acid-binding protein
MGLVLDASAVLAWFVQRSDRREAQLAEEILASVERDEAVVPAMWFVEVVNGLLVAERIRRGGPSKAALFLGELAALPIAEDRVRPSVTQGEVLTLAHRHGLSAYDAVYMELSFRTNRALATFDKQLAKAMRKAGGRVFGDAA